MINGSNYRRQKNPMLTGPLQSQYRRADIQDCTALAGLEENVRIGYEVDCRVDKGRQLAFQLLAQGRA